MQILVITKGMRGQPVSVTGTLRAVYPNGLLLRDAVIGCELHDSFVPGCVETRSRPWTEPERFTHGAAHVDPWVVA